MSILTITLIAVALSVLAACIAVCYYKRRATKTQRENDTIRNRMQEIEQQHNVIKQQRDNQRERQKHEERMDGVNRDELVDSLSKAGDLRD